MDVERTSPMAFAKKRDDRRGSARLDDSGEGCVMALGIEALETARNPPDHGSSRVRPRCVVG